MRKTFNDLMREARAVAREVWPDEAARMAASGVTLVDVREEHEWEEGHIPGAIHVPRGYLEQEIEANVPDHHAPVILYCAGGVRSLLAAKDLREMGYADPISMFGGFQLWKSEGRPWTQPKVLTPDQKKRYSRHLLIPEVGSEGQAKLLASRVLFIGAGGLGAPAMLYLAAAGVGTIGIIDFDIVDVSNLQRQIVHTTDRVGQKKTDSAARSIHALNPDIEVVEFDEMLTEENVRRIIEGFDVVVDGTDTFETRYILNDAAVRAGIPVVHASVFRFEGQLTVFQPYAGPCYRCLYPTAPPPELAPGCSVAGVLGVVPGTLGILQATEALKLLLGIGEPLIGRLLIYDALDMSFQELKLRRDPHCPACGDGAPAHDAVAGAAGVAGASGPAPVAQPLAARPLQVRPLGSEPIGRTAR
jgi:molybdopterin/thiamine biosynthesis adenylyltransferase/rhodanese-related sulfurtransferase